MLKPSLTYICLTILLLFNSCSSEESIDLIIINGHIETMDEDATVFEALAVDDGVIIYLGENQGALDLKTASTQVIDAKDQFVMPGFIEGHGHFSGLGSSLMNLNFLKSKNWNEIVKAVEEKVQTAEEGEWIIGRGWHQEKWDEALANEVHGYPYHDALSKISPNNPVMLTHASGHGLFANENAMKLSGISKETGNPVGGEIVRGPEGEAIGMFEERAMVLIRAKYQEYINSLSQEDLTDRWYEGIEKAMEECISNGITSFQDAGSSYTEIERYTDMANDGDLDLRLYAMLRHNSETMEGNLSGFPIINEGDGFFTCRAIKTELDGALGSYGAWLLKQYSDKQNFHGQNTTSIEEMNKIADLCIKHDMQLCVHAIGDRANREVLDVVEEKYAVHGADKDRRWRIEHAQHLHPEDIPRFKELDVIASMQGVHCTSDAPFVTKRLGKLRAMQGAYAWRSLLDAGAVVMNGTDAPVEDVNPLESFYATVTRTRSDNGFEFFPEQSLSRREALHSYTLANAYGAFEEKQKGSLELGKYADITILDKNLISCSAPEILDARVQYTIIDGKIKYQKN